MLASTTVVSTRSFALVRMIQQRLGHVKPRRISRIQIIAVSILSIAGVINYIDRGSLAIANTTIRADLGMSATRVGILLSIFSLSYAISQLPMGILLDRFGDRII